MNKLTLIALNEKYKDYPETVNKYEIEGKKYIVHSHFVGNKDIDIVVRKIAYQRAMIETLNIAA